jgi:hypothetical protein
MAPPAVGPSDRSIFVLHVLTDADEGGPMIVVDLKEDPDWMGGDGQGG